MKTTMIYLRQLLALCVVMVAFAACGDDEKNEGGSSSASGIQLNTIDKITCYQKGLLLILILQLVVIGQQPLVLLG